MHHMPRIDKEETILQSQRFSVVKQEIDFNGEKHEQEQVVMGAGIALVALDSQQNVFMVREWRSAANDYITQIPGGYGGKEDEQELLQIARQEALEELGIEHTNTLRKVKSFMPVGGMRGKLHIFFMENADQTLPQTLETSEDVAIVKIPLREAYNRFVLGDELTTSATIIGLTLAMEQINKIKTDK